MSAPAQLVAALADRYTIEREIGAGGMATVYLARDVKHDREVALKALSIDDGSSRQLWKGLAERGTFSLQDDGSFIVDVLDGVRAFYR